jgi:DNA sulfur modification protein DndE
MFSSIKTSEENREVISELTSKLALGKENVIARIALGYSLSFEKRLSLLEIHDSRGKEYTRRILLGDHESIYVALVCQLYEISTENPDLGKYVKLHVDDGLERLYKRFMEDNVDGLDLVLGLVG